MKSTDVATPTTELLIARHGEAHCNRAGIIGGLNGCRGLTDRGRRQVERLAHRLSEQHHERPIHALYATPLRRSQESAAIIGAYLGLDAEVVTDLAEQHHGSGDGRTWRDVVSEFGDIPALFADRPLARGGETWAQYLERSSTAVGQLLALHSGERILIVGHGETVETAFHYFLDLPPTSRSTVALAAHYASVTVWEQQPLSWTRPTAGLRWTLMAQNDTRHLVVDDHKRRSPDVRAGRQAHDRR
ncbi:histidine phosphatase family protein [Nocardia wallacei]|uniref:histidine phosphatase family protein n=1 Tax=Nocardia wallacei TaxID=480035 RepID=UPI003CC7DF00